MLIYSNLDLWAKTQPDKVCLKHSNTQLTYCNLAQKVDFTARSIANTIQKGEKVIIRHPDPIMQLIFLLGAAKAGAASILADISMPLEYFRNLIANVNPAVLIDDSYSLQCGKPGILPEVTRDDIFFGALSSGSTSMPKLIWRDHQSWVEAFPYQSMVFNLGNSDRLFLTGSLAYTANLNSCLHILHEGGTIFLSKSRQPRSWAKEITENEITGIFMVPTNYRLLIKVLTNPLYKVKSMVSAGSKIDINTVNFLISYFPKAQLFEYYGASELGHISYSNANDLIKHPNSVGKAFPNVKFKINDGLIWVESPFLAPDYRPQSTIGDMGEIDSEGYLYLLGRENNIINSGGLKIIPEEVEAILNNCPDIAASIVKGIDDPLRGQKIVAWVVKSNPGINAESIKAHCKKYLPISYIPQKINFIKKLPLNTNGKIDRVRL